MEHMITCIKCPVGCRMTVILSDDGKFKSVSGNTCKRGAAYAEQECTMPLRMVTAVIPIRGSKEPLPVKTTKPVPKALIFQIMKILSEVDVCVPVKLGDTIVESILGTGVDIIATKSLFVSRK